LRGRENPKQIYDEIIDKRFGAVMTDLFTLNPRYERYELGVYPLEYETVYGIERHPLGRTLVSATFMMLMYTVLAKYDMAISGRASDSTLNLALIIALVIYAIWVIPTEIFTLLRTMKVKKSYARLIGSGILIEGQVYEIRIREQRVNYLESWLKKPANKGLYFVDFIYKFTSPEQRVVYGVQTVVRVYQDLYNQPPPPDGTPIRVLYADDNTHVML
jgi:hypothetical protein